MAIERPRRRAAWKLGSIAAAVAGSAVVAVVATRRRSTRVTANGAGPFPARRPAIEPPARPEPVEARPSPEISAAKVDVDPRPGSQEATPSPMPVEVAGLAGRPEPPGPMAVVVEPASPELLAGPSSPMPVEVAGLEDRPGPSSPMPVEVAGLADRPESPGPMGVVVEPANPGSLAGPSSPMSVEGAGLADRPASPRPMPVGIGGGEGGSGGEVDDEAEQATPSRPAGGSRVRRWVAGGVAAGIIGAVVVVAVVAGGGDGGTERPAAADVTEPRRTTTTDVADLSAGDAFGQAAAQLRDAGGFSYTGTSTATDVSPVRPGLWLAVDLTVTGDVDLASGRLRETATAADDQAIETVSDGVTVWGRVGDAGFLTIGEPSDAPVPRGAALLPVWLNSAVEPEALPDDGSGGRRFKAQLPAEVLGVVVDDVAPVPGELQLSLDSTGNLTKVELTVTEGPLLHLVFDITNLGRVAPIDLPEG